MAWILSDVKHGNLFNRLLAFMEGFFKLTIPGVEPAIHSLIYVQAVKHNGGKFEANTELIIVTEQMKRHVVSINEVIGVCHLVPLPLDSPNGPHSYYVNSRIDMETYNSMDVTMEKGRRIVVSD